MDTEQPEAAPAPVPWPLILLLLGVAALVLAGDQIAKAVAVSQLTGRPPVAVVPGVFWFELTRNPGAAFNFATGSTWVFTVIAVLVAGVILRLARRLGTHWWSLALGLLLGGALGNLTDRLVRAPGFGRGQVVDFLAVPNFPIFNVADSAITVAAVLIVWLGLRGIGIDGGSTRD